MSDVSLPYTYTPQTPGHRYLARHHEPHSYKADTVGSGNIQPNSGHSDGHPRWVYSCKRSANIKNFCSFNINPSVTDLGWLEILFIVFFPILISSMIFRQNNGHKFDIKTVQQSTAVHSPTLTDVSITCQVIVLHTIGFTVTLLQWQGS